MFCVVSDCVVLHSCVGGGAHIECLPPPPFSQGVSHSSDSTGFYERTGAAREAQTGARARRPPTCASDKKGPGDQDGALAKAAFLSLSYLPGLAGMVTEVHSEHSWNAFQALPFRTFHSRFLTPPLPILQTVTYNRLALCKRPIT